MSTELLKPLSVSNVDFSRGNVDEQSRIDVVTKVASICYNNPKAMGSVKLFDRLGSESGGLPSSSYEFIPVLFNVSVYPEKFIGSLKFGELVENGKYYLTNMRDCLRVVTINDIPFNASDEDISVIARNLHTYKLDIDIVTARQLVRHRVASYQELSRRYVNGKKLPFTFYMSEKLHEYSDIVLEHYDNSIALYTALLNSGILAEDARRVIPQGAMTVIYVQFLPFGYENFIKLRTKKSAQEEMQFIANCMRDM